MTLSVKMNDTRKRESLRIGLPPGNENITVLLCKLSIQEGFAFVNNKYDKMHGITELYKKRLRSPQEHVILLKKYEINGIK